MIDKSFKLKIEKLMAQLPDGKLTTYGDLATFAGSPYAARVVGGIAHFGNPDLPWHRLVNRFGGLAAGFPGGRESQEAMLKQDGIEVVEGIVSNFEGIRWRPNRNL